MNNAGSSQNKEVAVQGFELAAEAMKKTVDKNPLDFRIHLLLARHYNSFYQFTSQASIISLAENMIDESIKLSPRNQQGYWALAQTRLFEEKYDDVINLLKKAVDLEPRYIPSRWYLFTGYRILKENDLALQELKNIENLGYDWKANLDDLKKVIELYENMQDDKTLAALYPIALEKDPKNAQFWAGFAVTQANLGDFQKTREYANKAVELDPSLKEKINEFLNSLPQ